MTKELSKERNTQYHPWISICLDPFHNELSNHSKTEYMAMKSEKQLDKLAEEILSEKKTASRSASKTKNFCDKYAKAKPFIEKAAMLLSLIKKTWGDVLKDLMGAMDEACPVAQDKEP